MRTGLIALSFLTLPALAELRLRYWRRRAEQARQARWVPAACCPYCLRPLTQPCWEECPYATENNN